MNTRFIVISSFYLTPGSKTPVPFMCIGGKWLEENGFITGREIRVEVRKYGELSISLIPCEESQEAGENKENTARPP